MLKWSLSIAHTATQLQLLKRKLTLPNYSKRTFDDLFLLKFLAGLVRRLAPSMLCRTSTLLSQMLRFPAPVSKGFSCTNFRSHVVQQIGQPRSNTSGSLNIRICLPLEQVHWKRKKISNPHTTQFMSSKDVEGGLQTILVKSFSELLELKEVRESLANLKGQRARYTTNLRWRVFPNLPSGSPHCDELFSGCRVNTNCGI